MSAAAQAPLLHTPLHALHLRLGARMVPFAGYSMPVQYPGGLIAEHRHCRASATRAAPSTTKKKRPTSKWAPSGRAWLAMYPRV